MMMATRTVRLATAAGAMTGNGTVSGAMETGTMETGTMEAGTMETVVRLIDGQSSVHQAVAAAPDQIRIKVLAPAVQVTLVPAAPDQIRRRVRIKGLGRVGLVGQDTSGTTVD